MDKQIILESNVVYLSNFVLGLGLSEEDINRIMRLLYSDSKEIPKIKI